MVLIVSITIIGIIFFFKLFYNSFVFNEIVYLFFFTISSIELVFYFYLFLGVNIFFIFKKNKNYFEDKQKIFKLFLLHLVVSVFLIITGAYTFSIVLQFIFLLSVFKSKDTFACIYFLSIHYTLLLLFGSGSFILYFLLLSASTVFMIKEKIFCKKERAIICIGVSLILTFFYINAEEFIYEIYIWLDIVDNINSLNGEVFFILTFIHVAIFVSIIIKKKKKVIFKKD